MGSELITTTLKDEILEGYDRASRELWSVVTDLEDLMWKVELANPNLRLSNTRMVEGLRWARSEMSRIGRSIEEVKILEV